MSAGIVASFDGNLHGLPVARGNYHRQSSVGSNWNEVRCGILYQVIPSANLGGTNDGASVAETVNFASYLDWMAFGLMNTRANSSVIPGVTGANFIGWLGNATAGSTATCASNSGGSAALAGTNATKWGATKDASIIASGNLGLGYGAAVQFAKYSATSYASFIGLRFVVANKGASNQTITAQMSDAGDGSGPGVGPYSITQATAITVLRTKILNAGYSTGVSLTWNASSTAIALPDCIFVRLPFYTNCLRISAYMVELIS